MSQRIGGLGIVRTKRHFSRHAQMEIMGIAVITILIVFGFLFFVRFSAFKDKGSNLQKDFQRASLSSYFLDGIQLTSINDGDCRNGGTFTDLATDCVLNNGCLPGMGGNPNPNCNKCKSAGSSTFDISSCDYLANNVKRILDATLKEQGKEYRFLLSDNDRTEVRRVASDDCINVPPGGFREQPLPNGVVISFAICQN